MGRNIHEFRTLVGFILSPSTSFRTGSAERVGVKCHVGFEAKIRCGAFDSRSLNVYNGSLA